jgi:hypothetical protein
MQDASNAILVHIRMVHNVWPVLATVQAFRHLVLFASAMQASQE